MEARNAVMRLGDMLCRFKEDPVIFSFSLYYWSYSTFWCALSSRFAAPTPDCRRRL